MLKGDFMGAPVSFAVFEMTQADLARVNRGEGLRLLELSSRRAFSFKGLGFVAEYAEFCGHVCLARLWPSLGSSKSGKESAFAGRAEKVTFEQWARDLTLIPFKSEFQKRVLTCLLAEARGRTLSYSELARLAASEGATRAVASVMAQNPWPVLFPCHRVLPKNSKLGDVGAYGGGKISSGAEIKSRLLAAEGF